MVDFTVNRLTATVSAIGVVMCGWTWAHPGLFDLGDEQECEEYLDCSSCAWFTVCSLIQH